MSLSLFPGIQGDKKRESIPKSGMSDWKSCGLGRTHGARSQEKWKEFQLGQSLIFCPWIYGFPLSGLTDKVKIFEYTRIHHSPFLFKDYDKFVTIHKCTYTWFFGYWTLSKTGHSRELSVFSCQGLTWKVFGLSFFLLQQDSPHVYSHCLLPWEMEGKKCALAKAFIWP